MGKLVRAISKDGSVMACAIDATDIAARSEQIHQTSPVITAAMGRLLAAAGVMGAMLKQENDSLTPRHHGKGPSGTLIAVSDGAGHVKGYPQNPAVELPLNERGKLDVKGAVGTDGFLSVVKDIGLKEPYSGQVNLISGEIAEDITHYYAVSEQTPTVCALGVLVDTDWSVKAAGGFLVQLLPFADESCIDVIEENIRGIPPVSAMIDEGMTPEEICNLLLQGLEPDILDTQQVLYTCDCSRERVERMLLSLDRKELAAMLEEDGGCEVCCHFCDKKYAFDAGSLSALIQKKGDLSSQGTVEEASDEGMVP